MSGNVGWDEEIVLRKRAEHSKVTRTSADINAARRSGAVVSTEKKVTSNAGHVGEDFRRLAKVAETDDIIAPKAISMDVGKSIAKARLAMEMTQKELGVKVNEKQTVVSYALPLLRRNWSYHSAPSSTLQQSILTNVPHLLPQILIDLHH